MSESFHPEKHRNVAGSWYRASVFGVSDGLVTNASLILGFAGANPVTTSCVWRASPVSSPEVFNGER